MAFVQVNKKISIVKSINFIAKQFFTENFTKIIVYYKIGCQANVNPKVDFIEDNKSDHVPPKIQGVRVIVDASKMNGTNNLNLKCLFQQQFEKFIDKI